MKLHGYWRSGAAYRVRLALALKGIAYEQATYDLRKADQKSPSYRAVQPQGLVPALECDGEFIIQSPAILEWLEERYPSPPLLPQEASARAVVRAMAAIIACDIHPLNNLRVLTSLRTDLHAQEDAVIAWIHRWIGAGFEALETMVGQYGGTFAYGDAPSIADVNLIPQIYSASRFNVDMAPFPRLAALADRVRDLPAFRAAEPEAQPDADRP